MTDARYVHYAFLVLNSVFFPAFLFLSDYFIAGLIVFAANLLALMFLFPRINLASYRQYYRRIFGNRENEIATVDLTEAGIVYSSDESEASFPWRRITSIEETPDAIYFFFAGNGFAVRKSGFAYEDEQKSFYDYARGRLSSVHAQQIEA